MGNLGGKGLFHLTGYGPSLQETKAVCAVKEKLVEASEKSTTVLYLLLNFISTSSPVLYLQILRHFLSSFHFQHVNCFLVLFQRLKSI